MIFTPPDGSSTPVVLPDDPETQRQQRRRSGGFAGSLPGGFFVEFFIIAAGSAFLAWICQLIEGRWPGTFPLATDFIYVMAFGCVVLLNAYLALVGRHYAGMLDAVAELGSSVDATGLLEETSLIVFAEKVGPRLAQIASEGRVQRRAVGRLVAHVRQLDSPVLHRVVQFSVYLLAAALPFAVWYTYQWFTVLVVPFAMTPLLLARQYAAKHHAAGRVANRFSKSWSAPQSTLETMRTGIANSVPADVKRPS